MAETLKLMFNRSNILHTIGAVLFAVLGYAGITSTDAAEMVSSSAGMKVLILGMAKIMLSNLSGALKEGTLVAQLTSNGKLDWMKAAKFFEGLVIASAIGMGVLQPDALSAVHAVSWGVVVYAVVSFFSEQLFHFNVAKLLLKGK